MSLDTEFSTLIGFTEAELRNNYTEVIKTYCEEDYVEKELRNIKIHYNGYKFNVTKLENRVYSPVSVIRHFISSLEFFKEFQQKKNESNESKLKKNK